MIKHAMLAHKYKPSKHNIVGWLMSEKLDGVRAIWDGKDFWSRNMKAITAPKWFKSKMPEQLILDGELWAGRGNFQQLISTVRKHRPIDHEWEFVTYKAFDCPMLKGTFEERLPFVPLLHRHIHTPVGSASHLQFCFDTIVSNGGEGLMLKNPRCQYEQGRSHNLLKLKPELTGLAIVVGYVPGLGKYEGMIGSLNCIGDGYAEFDVGSGLTDDQRLSIHAFHGKRIQFSYQELTRDDVPRFPVFVRVLE